MGTFKLRGPGRLLSLLQLKALFAQEGAEISMEPGQCPRTSLFTKTSPPVEANADHGLGSRGGPADHLTGSLLTN